MLRNPLRSDEERGPDRLGERRSFGRLAHAGRDSLIQLPCRSGTVGKTPPESEVAESWSRHIHLIESNYFNQTTTRVSLAALPALRVHSVGHLFSHDIIVEVRGD